MNFMHFQMLEVIGEPGTEQQFIERTIALNKDLIEGIAELSEGRCMVFTSNRQVLVKADYLETIGALNING